MYIKTGNCQSLVTIITVRKQAGVIILLTKGPNCIHKVT